MGTVRVTNKTAGVISLTLPGHRGSVDLQPGLNEVDAEAFKAATGGSHTTALGKKLNITDAMRDAGQLEWDGDSKAASKPITELSESEAASLIKSTFARDQLDQFAKQDSRTSVQKAITDQRAFVAAQNKPGDEGDASDDTAKNVRGSRAR